MNYQPTKVLTKVYSSTLAAAGASILVWLLESYGRADIPEHIVIALTTILTFVAGYITPIAPGEIEPVESSRLVDMPRRERVQDRLQVDVALLREIARQEATKALADVSLSPSLQDAITRNKENP